MAYQRTVRRIVLGPTIRGRFGRSLILAGLAPVVMLFLYVATSQRADLAAVANANLASQARLQAAAVATIIDQAAESVMALAANPALRDADAPSTELRDQLEAYSLFEEVTLLDPRGAVIEATSYGYAGRWDTNAAFRGALQGQEVMTPPLLYPNPERFVVEFAGPVVDDDGLVAVVVASMNMDRVWRALDGATFGQTGFFAAFDQHGNVIAHPDKTLLLRKLAGYPRSTEDPGAGSVRFRQPDGTVLVGRAALVGSSGWQVTALQRETETYALANDAMSNAAAAGLMVLLLTALLAIVLSRAIVRPMRSVGEAMHQVADGDMEQRVILPGLDEIDDLAESFNAMAERLEERSHSLESEMAERDRAEQRITYQAHHDTLTGLPNRALLKDRLDVALADARRSGKPLALMFLDLDRFKLVNDSVGHSSGDELLQRVTDRILSVVREGDTLARVGGDEYVLLLPQVAGAQGAVGAAKRVQESLRRPFELRGRDFRVTASIGVAMHPHNGADVESLLRSADLAMYQAKGEGRDAIRFFSVEMDESVQKRVRLERDLRAALQLGRFVLHYQPLVHTASGRIIGVEGL
ncbi:MAG: diguanylate cyclase domain-containing protein, partial [Chloroflexota bacterium]